MQVLAPLEMRLGHRSGLAVRRTAFEADDWLSWAGGRIAAPMRMVLDLLLARPLPDAVADLDALLYARKVDRYDGDWRDGEAWALNRVRARLNRVHAAGWDVVFVTAPLLRDERRLPRTVRQAIAA